MTGIVYIFTIVSLLILIAFVVRVIHRNIKSYRNTGNRAYLFLAIMNTIFTIVLTIFTIINILR